MKRFSELREASKSPQGEKVFSKRINKASVVVYKNKNKFDVYIDGDKLDTFKSQAEAEIAGESFAKEL